MGQTFLDFLADGTYRRGLDPAALRVLNWNVQHPSLSRAINQYSIIAQYNADIVILTELADSEASMFLSDRLHSDGYLVAYTPPPRREYSALVAAKSGELTTLPLATQILPHRVAILRCTKNETSFLVIGLYVPSRGGAEGRNVKKMQFQSAVENKIRTWVERDQACCVIIGGDLNVIEPDHIPRYRVFADWEYRFYRAFLDAGLVDAYRHKLNGPVDHSWIGRARDGYRFDHLFLSTPWGAAIRECGYDHSTRRSDLSDHSAMTLTVEVR
ncbi:MAG: endonuclease [Elusimicrobia bacterium]|nr:endonuclease [Elusimicrobiota bacterium]